jgi:regulator of sirC expression with transglutaminase-like and TPR domain
VGPGKVGLAKFRDTKAEFKSFQLAAKIADEELSGEIKERTLRAAQAVSGPAVMSADQLGKLLADAPASTVILRDEAIRLEQRASQLKALAQSIHQKRIMADLGRIAGGKDEEIDLLRGALLIARLDNDEVDVDAYVKEVERMARELAAELPAKADKTARRGALDKYLFEEHGFHGSRSDFYNRSNSYLNEVIDDREGLPITLAVLYMELGGRIGLKLEGVGLPGHFIVKQVQDEPIFVDVFEAGKVLTRADLESLVRGFTGRPLHDRDLVGSPRRAILLRMLQNLLGLARNERDTEAALRYLDASVAIDSNLAQERWARAYMRYQMGRPKEALDDADWLLEHRPDGLDVDALRKFRHALEHGGER